MSYSIVVSGEAIFDISGARLHLPSEIIKQTKLIQNSEQSYDEDSIEWLATFEARVAGLVFRWVVQYTIGFTDSSLSDHELVSSPPGAELTKNVGFELVEEEETLEEIYGRG